MEPSGHPLPNWEALFLRRPDLSPPGYKETCAKLASKDAGIEIELARARMRQIRGDKQKLVTKNRTANKRRPKL